MNVNGFEWFVYDFEWFFNDLKFFIISFYENFKQIQHTIESKQYFNIN